MRSLMILGLVCLPSVAFAYDGFSPLSGPNTAIPSPVCDIVNFGFCPQPPSPPPALPDPNAVAQAPQPIPASVIAPYRHHRRAHHRRMMQTR